MAIRFPCLTSDSLFAEPRGAEWVPQATLIRVSSPNFRCFTPLMVSQPVENPCMNVHCHIHSCYEARPNAS